MIRHDNNSITIITIVIQNISNIHKPNFDIFLFADMLRSRPNAGLYTVRPKHISSIFSSSLRPSDVGQKAFMFYR